MSYASEGHAPFCIPNATNLGAQFCALWACFMLGVGTQSAQLAWLFCAFFV